MYIYVANFSRKRASSERGGVWSHWKSENEGPLWLGCENLSVSWIENMNVLTNKEKYWKRFGALACDSKTSGFKSIEKFVLVFLRLWGLTASWPAPGGSAAAGGGGGGSEPLRAWAGALASRSWSPLCENGELWDREELTKRPPKRYRCRAPPSTLAVVELMLEPSVARGLSGNLEGGAVFGTEENFFKWKKSWNYPPLHSKLIINPYHSVSNALLL